MFYTQTQSLFKPLTFLSETWGSARPAALSAWNSTSGGCHPQWRILTRPRWQGTVNVIRLRSLEDRPCHVWHEHQRPAVPIYQSLFKESARTQANFSLKKQHATNWIGFFFVRTAESVIAIWPGGYIFYVAALNAPLNFFYLGNLREI